MEQAKQWRYEAFVSYRHQALDTAAAKTVHAVVERFRAPKWARTAGKKRRVFRDQEELPTSADLGSDIDTALGNSKYLVVICSPALLESRWCQKEIDTFIAIGRKAYILPVLIAGDEFTAIPECIRDLAVCIDARAEGKRGVCRSVRTKKAALLSPVLEVECERLERTINRRRWTVGTAAFVMATALAVGVGAYALQTGRTIQAQNDELIEATEALKSAEALAIQEREAAYVSRSAFLAEGSSLALSAENEALAAALVLKALPEDIDNPSHAYSPDALAALRALYYSKAQSSNEYLPLLHMDFGFKVARHSEAQNDYVIVYSPQLDNYFAYYYVTTGERMEAKDPIILTDAPLTVTLDRGNFICAGFADRLETYVTKGTKNYEDGIMVLFEEAEPGAGTYTKYRKSEWGSPQWDIFYGAETLPLTISRWNHADEGGRTLNGEPFACDEILTFGGEYMLLAYQTYGRNGQAPKAAIFEYSTTEAKAALDTEKRILMADYARNYTSVGTIDEDGALKLWDVRTGKLLRVLDEKEQFISLDFVDSSTRLFAITRSGEGILFDTLTGERVYIVNEGVKMLCARFETTMGYIAAGFDDGRVCVYKADTGIKLMEVQNGTSITEVSFVGFDSWLYNHNADRLMVWGEDDAGNTTLDIYKLSAMQTGEDKQRSIVVSDVRLDSSTVTARFSRDGTKLLICVYTNNYGIYDTKTGEVITVNTQASRYSSSPDYIGAVFNYDETGVWVTSGVDERGLELYDAQTSELITTLKPAAPDSSGVAQVFHTPGAPQYSRDGSLMMIEAPYNEGFCIYDASTYEYLWGHAATGKTYNGANALDTATYQKATLSEDGKTLAILWRIYKQDFFTNYYVLERRDTRTGKTLSKMDFSNTTTGYEDIWLSPDLSLVACRTVEDDGAKSFFVLDAVTGETLITRELKDNLGVGCWTADGKALRFSDYLTGEMAVYGVDGTIRRFTYGTPEATRLILTDEDIFSFGEYAHVYVADKLQRQYVPSTSHNGRYLIDVDTGNVIYDAGENTRITANPNGENMCVYSVSFFGTRPRLLLYKSVQEQMEYVETLTDGLELSEDELARYALGNTQTEAAQ